MMKRINTSLSLIWTIAVAVALLAQCNVASASARAARQRVGGSAAAASAANSKTRELTGQTSTLLPDGRLILTGGEEQNQAVATVSIEDPVTGTIKQLPNHLGQARYWHTATVLPNGTVLIFGGVGSDGKIVQQSEILDLSDMSVRPVVTTGLTPRAFHTATILTDGRLLVAGGVSESGQVTSRLDFWDFRTYTGKQADTILRMPREAHTASLQSDGTILFCGGNDGSGKALTACEVFYPTDQLTQVLSSVPAEEETMTPSIAASIPEGGEHNVSVSPLIALRFSKLVAVSSVTNNTVALHGPEGDIPVLAVGAEAGRLAFILPSKSLLAGTSYTLTTSGITDLSGIPLSAPTIRFTTAGETQESAIAPAIPPTPSDPFNSPSRKLPALRAPKGVTAVSGQVLQLNGEPLLNTTLQIGDVVAHTDGTGRFLLSNIPAGHQVMWIDGSTAKNRGLSYGIYEDGVDVVAKKTNVLDYTIWMTALDTSDEVTLPSPTDREMIVSSPLLPGLELHLPAGTVIHDRNDQVVTKIGITPIPINQPPFPLPKGVSVPLYFTIQPGGAYLEGYGQGADTAVGARLFYPNSSHLPPSTTFNFWNYDADSKGWYVYGQGMVTADKKQVVPNPGVMIYEFTGAMVANPGQPPTGPNPGNTGPGKDGGDPVDLQTGLFVYNKTDLSLPDVVPIRLTRTYRPMDPVSRAFGIGTMSNYDIYLTGDGSTYSYIDLIQADGGRIHYDRISAGTSYMAAVYENLTASTPFYGSQIAWNGVGWTLSMKNGTKMIFPESSGAGNFLQAALIGFVDRNGNTATLTRDSNLNLTRITSPNGRWIQYTYDSLNRVTQASDNSGRTVYYTYDTAGRLHTAQDANGGITTYGYDTNNNMTTIQDPRHITYVANHYDANNMVDQQTMADGTTYKFHYVLNQGGVSTGYVVQGLTSSEADVTDPRNNVRKVFFNSEGYMSSEVLAFGQPEQQTITYNHQAGTGLLLSMTDALNRTTSYTYDALGNLTSTTKLSGTPNAATTSTTYEAQFNQVIATTDAIGQTTSLTYDGHGNIVGVTNPDGTTLSLSRDTLGRVLSVTDALGNATQASYSGADVLTITDPLQRTHTQFADSAGRIISETNALGQTTQSTVDSLNQITGTIDPLGNLTAAAYDPNGNAISITDALHTTTPTAFAFDNIDRFTGKTDPLGNPESLVYDPNGNLIQFTDRRGKITSFRYDALNRCTFVGYGTQPGPSYESTITYTWDNGNRVTQFADSAAGTTTRTYNDLDNVTSETSPLGTVNYTPDAIGRRLTMTVSGQPQTIYSYDASNRVIQLTQGSATVQFGYDSLGRRTSMTLPSGVVANYAYDAASELAGITFSKGSESIGDLEYAYDRAGRRTTVSGSFARTAIPQQTAGNTYNSANQLTQLNGLSLTYDANGNLTGDGLHTYTWNARNQLVSIDSGGMATYAYDALGRRVVRTITGVSTTNFLYDGFNPVQEISGGVASANLIAGGIDEEFARTDTSGTSNLLADAQGSVLALTDANGVVQTQYTYDPFGGTTMTGASTTNSAAYTGRELDAAGLYFYRARYYNSTTGRFLSEDPKGFRGSGPDLYAYTDDSPTNFVDPTGELPDKNNFKIYGNWCGPGWTGGKWESYDPSHDRNVQVKRKHTHMMGVDYTVETMPYYKAPDDALDAACEEHDKCYARCRSNHPCDRGARKQCMTGCNQALALAAGLSGVGGPREVAIEAWMESQPGIDEPNAPTCKCSK